jgi:hypothetical protein
MTYNGNENVDNVIISIYIALLSVIVCNFIIKTETCHLTKKYLKYQG